MATNFEFYKDEILHWFENCGTDCLADFHGKISGVEFECKAHDECNACGKRLVEFLKQEHIEKPKLTKWERAFCEAVQTGWIIKDAHAECYWVEYKPDRGNGGWWTVDGLDYVRMTPLHLFAFIKREDEKPWAVEDLLKLEVMEK